MKDTYGGHIHTISEYLKQFSSFYFLKIFKRFYKLLSAILFQNDKIESAMKRKYIIKYLNRNLILINLTSHLDTSNNTSQL